MREGRGKLGPDPSIATPPAWSPCPSVRAPALPTDHSGAGYPPRRRLPSPILTLLVSILVAEEDQGEEEVVRREEGGDRKKAEPVSPTGGPPRTPSFGLPVRGWTGAVGGRAKPSEAECPRGALLAWGLHLGPSALRRAGPSAPTVRETGSDRRSRGVLGGHPSGRGVLEPFALAAAAAGAGRDGAQWVKGGQLVAQAGGVVERLGEQTSHGPLAHKSVSPKPFSSGRQRSGETQAYSPPEKHLGERVGGNTSVLEAEPTQAGPRRAVAGTCVAQGPGPGGGRLAAQPRDHPGPAMVARPAQGKYPGGQLPPTGKEWGDQAPGHRRGCRGAVRRLARTGPTVWGVQEGAGVRGPLAGDRGHGIQKFFIAGEKGGLESVLRCKGPLVNRLVGAQPRRLGLGTRASVGPATAGVAARRGRLEAGKRGRVPGLSMGPALAGPRNLGGVTPRRVRANRTDRGRGQRRWQKVQKVLL